MDKKKFEAVLMLLIPQIVHLIAEKYSYDEVTAAADFYNSGVYAMLEQEETKLWHFSPMTLLQMFEEEKSSGSFSLPEEA